MKGDGIMAHIRKVQFARVGKNEGCTCDRCGQYIQNIWTVYFDGDDPVHFGIDCFEKLNRESLNDYGMKLMKKALKRLENLQERYEKELALTEETDIRYQGAQVHHDWCSDDYWNGRPWEEYHNWRVNDFFGLRFEECQKEIDRFKKVNYKL